MPARVLHDESLFTALRALQQKVPMSTSKNCSLVLASSLVVIVANCRASDPPQAEKDRRDRQEAYRDQPAAATGSAVASSSAAHGAAGHYPVGASSGGAATHAAASSTVTGALAGPPLDDGQIATVTDGVHSAEIAQAELARSKSKNDKVLAFAKMMIEHHGAAKLKQQKLKLTTSASPLSAQLGGDANTTLEDLKLKSGAEFDRAYFQAQIDGHQTALEAIDNELLPAAKSSALQAYLKELKPQVAHHLEQAKAGLQALP